MMAGAGVDSVLLAFIAVGLAGWLLWALWFFSPLGRRWRQGRRQGLRLLYTVLAAVAFGVAGVSLALGRTSIGAGTVLREVEPQRFWWLVKLQAGAGGVLLVLALLSPRRDR